jgi:PPOX class probable F420-dependent enzyme
LHGNVIVSAIDHKPKRTNDLKRLRNIATNPRVSVLADHYTDDWSLLWWVRADGHARILHGNPEPISWLVAKYDQYTNRPPAGPVIWIDITRWRYWSPAD